MPTHLINTSNFLQKFQSQVSSDCIIASFDVVSLYTNIPNDRAVDIIMELLQEHAASTNLHGFTRVNIYYLLHAILSANLFTFAGAFYQQVRGLAMGNRIAPILAVTFMHHLEKNAIYFNPSLQVRLYVRYIDDIFIAVNTEEALQEAFNRLKNQCETIDLTMERPDKDGWLAFLEVEARVLPILETKWYKKPANKNILLHSKSAHPASMKSNIISNFFARVNSYSSRPHVLPSRQRAADILNTNGYNIDLPRKCASKTDIVNLRRRISGPNLPIPYISEKFTREIRRILKNHNLSINVSVKPPPNLRQILSRSRLYEPKTCHLSTKTCEICNKIGKVGVCKLKGCVYRLDCECGHFYIGETHRSLYQRLDDHLRHSRNPNSNSYRNEPLARHIISNHPKGARPNIMISILESNIRKAVDRKVAEAFYISTLQPQINSKQEMDGIDLLIQ